MKSLDELKDIAAQIAAASNKVSEEVWQEIYLQAPVVVHQKLCSELVKTMKSHPKTVSADIPKAVKILEAIALLEDLYPNLKKNT